MKETKIDGAYPKEREGPKGGTPEEKAPVLRVIMWKFFVTILLYIFSGRSAWLAPGAFNATNPAAFFPRLYIQTLACRKSRPRRSISCHVE